MNFARNIKYLRDKLDMNIEELAPLMKINKNTLSAYERGKSKPYIDVVEKFARFFKVMPGELLDKNFEEGPTAPIVNKDWSMEAHVNALMDNCKERLKEKDEIIKSQKRLIELLEDRLKLLENDRKN